MHKTPAHNQELPSLACQQCQAWERISNALTASQGSCFIITHKLPQEIPYIQSTPSYWSSWFASIRVSWWQKKNTTKYRDYFYFSCNNVSLFYWIFYQKIKFFPSAMEPGSPTAIHDGQWSWKKKFNLYFQNQIESWKIKVDSTSCSRAEMLWKGLFLEKQGRGATLSGIPAFSGPACRLTPCPRLVKNYFQF